MHTRWFRYLLAVMFVLMLLPVMAFARDHDRDWDRHHDRHNRNYSNRYYNNGSYGNGYYHNRYYGNSGYWGNGYNRNYRCVDPDHDGDCDYYVRRRHHHGNYQNGWYNNGYYPNTNGWYGYYPNGYAGIPYVSPYTWGTGYAYNQDRRGVYNPPRGWQQGRKKGWGKSNLPPGLAKKSGWW